MVGGYDGGVGGEVSGFRHGGTGDCPMYGLGGISGCGACVDECVAKPGLLVCVYASPEECVLGVLGVVGLVGGVREGVSLSREVGAQHAHS